MRVTPEYPAEQNLGQVYFAKDALKTFYRKLDPTNSFNAGIGKTSKLKFWREGDARTNKALES